VRVTGGEREKSLMNYHSPQLTIQREVKENKVRQRPPFAKKKKKKNIKKNTLKTPFHFFKHKESIKGGWERIEVPTSKERLFFWGFPEPHVPIHGQILLFEGKPTQILPISKDGESGL